MLFGFRALSYRENNSGHVFGIFGALIEIIIIWLVEIY